MCFLLTLEWSSPKVGSLSPNKGWYWLQSSSIWNLGQSWSRILAFQKSSSSSGGLACNKWLWMYLLSVFLFKALYAWSHPPLTLSGIGSSIAENHHNSFYCSFQTCQNHHLASRWHRWSSGWICLLNCSNQILWTMSLCTHLRKSNLSRSCW